MDGSKPHIPQLTSETPINRFLLFLFYLTLLMGAFLLSGCAHVISQELREKIDKELRPDVLFRDPEAYKGKMVMLGGIIVSSENTDEGTYIEVLQKPLDYRGRPQDTDISYGRFIILYEKYLDAAIYSMGKEITVAGEIVGKTVLPLGEIQYPYVFIKGKEIHLFEPRSDIPIRFSIGIWAIF